MKKLLFLILFSVLSYSQGIKITALAEASNITQDDLLVIVDSPLGTPVTKKLLFSKMLDSIKAVTLGYSILQDPFTRYMADETDRINIPKFDNPYFTWQTNYNSGMDRIDSAVKYFDPVYFEVNGDTVTATDEWNLIGTNDYPVLDSVYNHSGTASSTSSIYRAIERAKALKLDLTGGTLTGTLTGTTINATTGFTLNGTSINTTGTLSNVAYKEQDNNFKVRQYINVSGDGAQTFPINIRNPFQTANTEVGIRFEPTNATIGGRYSAITAFNNGNDQIGLKFITGNAGTITEKWRIGYAGNLTNTGTDGTEALDVTGKIKASSGFIVPSLAPIRTNTVEGSDNAALLLMGAGGGYSGGGYTGRGAVILISGNQYSGYEGDIRYYAGKGTGVSGKERHLFYVNDTYRLKIDSAGATVTGDLTASGNIKASGTITGTTITGSQFKLSELNTAPAKATDTGTTGEIRIVNGFIYVCVATNTWQRATLATW